MMMMMMVEEVVVVKVQLVFCRVEPEARRDCRYKPYSQRSHHIPPQGE